MRKLLVVLGLPIDNLTLDEALDPCEEFIAAGRATGRTHLVPTVNTHFVVNALHDPELQRILREADMTTADGMPMVWASRLLGVPLPGRVTGADMAPALAARASRRGHSIYGVRERAPWAFCGSLARLPKPSPRLRPVCPGGRRRPRVDGASRADFVTRPRSPSVGRDVRKAGFSDAGRGAAGLLAGTWGRPGSPHFTN